MGYPPDMLHGGYGMREPELRMMEMRGMGHPGHPSAMYDPYSPGFGPRPAGCYKYVIAALATTGISQLTAATQVWHARPLCA